MKKRSLLLSLIFLLLAFTAQSQIVTKYQQGFEATGENYSYTVTSGNATAVTNYYSSGSRALKLPHTITETVVVLDTIDFSDNGSYQYAYLEFMHICDVSPLATSGPTSVATVEVKVLNPQGSQDWQVLGGNDSYDASWGGGSTEFIGNSSFSEMSYPIWTGATTRNTWWKLERFKLFQFLNGVDLANRKLLVRFRLHARTIGYQAGVHEEAWYIDRIKVSASPNSMLIPIIDMVDYPDNEVYPNSRSARIAVDFSTTLTQGMCNDSVYMEYQLGRSAQVVKRTLTPVANHTGRYQGYIPFCGYDTTVRFRVIGKDNSINHNTASYPLDPTAWGEFHFTRGTEQTYTPISSNSSSGNNTMPFPSYGDYKCEILYDSAELSQVFKPGAITQLRFPVAANVSNSTRNRFIVKMSNVVSGVEFPSNSKFYTEYQKLVYDSSLVITQNNNTLGTINLQDTFFYAGKGLRITMISDNVSSDPSAVSVRTANAPNNSTDKGAIHIGFDVAYNFSPFTSDFFQQGSLVTTRPNFYFRTLRNAPLLYDCGVSGFIHPNDSTPAVAYSPNNVVVTLKNYGSQPINAVRIYYQVDDSTHKYYDWTGTLAGGGSTDVTISTTQRYTPGYHEMLAWVDDSVTSAGLRFRDHEPFNDTLWTRFIACDGPMRGIRTVGNPGDDYATLDRFLYAVSQCGVDSVLTVKMAPGVYYGPVVIPFIPGASATNYVQFEPHGTANSVLFNAPTPAVGSTLLTNAVVNMQQTRHVRFKDINFGSNATQSRATYLVRMGTNSVDCQFINCIFTEGQGVGVSESFMTASSLLYSGGADSLLVRGCHFYRGTQGLNLVGPAQDNKARGSRVLSSFFEHQNVNSIIVRNQIDAEVDSNTCDQVYSNSSYAILLQDCSGATRVTRNTVYVTSGASCIGATNFFGSASGYAVVANNMLISADDGQSNMLTTPLNIITADHAKVIFNSIKMTAPQRNGIAAATFGGGILSNSYFYNNIVGCYDTLNCAFSYIPTDTSVNYIGYNIYYSLSPVLNKYDGINCYTMANWLSHLPSDFNSQNVNPGFLNITATDLRSYSQNVKAHGVPFAEVTNDIFDTLRNSTTPCVGAFEFSALPYDFEIIEFVEPYDEYCVAPTAAPLRVVIKNSGVNAYNPATQTMQLTYSRGTQPGQMAPGVSGNVVINRVIPALDTIIFNTGATIPFPTNGNSDTTYKLYAWLTSTFDPNPANDTSLTTVTSHYHYPAPTGLTHNSSYGNPATVTVNNGLQTWYSNVYTASTQHQSTVYWYSDVNAEPIWRGNTLTTAPLYQDTTFYIRQRRDFPLVKITEVQFAQNLPGVTYPMPLWMNGQSSFAVELTNVGDYPASLEGDTLQTVSNTSNLRHVYRFPNVTIQPGQTLVVQFVTSLNNIDSTKYLPSGKRIVPSQTANLGVVYRSGGRIMDALAINNIKSQNDWNNLNVPNYVWFGPEIKLVDTIPSAGFTRISWPTTTSSYTNSNIQWRYATDDSRMTLGTTDTRLIRYTDNGCPGDTASVHIHLIDLPNVDMVVNEFNLSDGCGMGVTPITVTVENRGAQPSQQVVLHYKATAITQYPGQALAVQQCSDTISASMAANSQLTHTFSVSPDFTVASASADFDFVVWVEKQSADVITFNDTVRMSLTSMYMPTAPNVKTYDTVVYDNVLTLTSLTQLTDSLAWYDRHMNPLDTCNVYVTGHIYEPDTFYVSAFGARINQLHIGTLGATNNYNAYPAVFNPNKRFVREQYLFTAQELIAAGHSAGPIQTVSFYLDTILAPAGTMTFTDYVLSIGTTNTSNFSSNNNWKTVNQYFSASSIVLSNANRGWVTHNLNNAFIWNGTDNIVIEVTRGMDAAITQGAKIRYTIGPSNSVIYKNDNNNSVAAFSGNGSRSNKRPDVLLGFVDYGCEGPVSPIYVAVINIPDADAALSWPDTAVAYSSCSPTPIQVALRNMGGQSIPSYTIDYWIDGQHGLYSSTQSLAANTIETLTVTNHLFTPGRHSLRVAVNVSGDTVQSNDTISKLINVRFCGGHYSIGTGGLYANFSAAVDTLMNAGVDGNVVFDVANGTYVEQINLGAIDGVSPTSTVVFRGDDNNPSNVTLRYAPVQANNYVLNIDGAEYVSFKGIKFASRGSGNYNHVISVANARQIRFDSVNIVTKGGLNNANASCLIIGDEVYSIYVTNSVIDSGYCGIRSDRTAVGLSEGVYITGNTIHNFMVNGITLRRIDDVHIVNNEIATGANTSRALTGIFVAQHEGPISVERNNVVLSDNTNGAKVGIRLVNISAANATMSLVSNNMCAMVGKNNNTTAAISIDSSSWMNVFFNTCRIVPLAYNGGTQTSKVLYVGTTSSQISIMNNTLCHDGAGYALYVQNAGNVMNCNFNDYYVKNDAGDFANFGNSDCLSLDDLRQANHMDDNSWNLKPYFVSNTDLHYSMGTLCERAQYNTLVPLDIDGLIRPQIPSPTIGAHEFERPNHNIAVMEIYSPTLGTDNVESDTLWVCVKLTNDGTSTESNLHWYAYIQGHPTLRTTNHNVDEMLPQDTLYDCNYIVMPLGVIDTQVVVVEFPLAGDAEPTNNTLSSTFFLHNAYNLQAISTHIYDESGCRLQNTEVGITLRNIGRKIFTAGTQVPIGFQAILQTAGLTVPTLPTSFVETTTLATDVEPNADIEIHFQQRANLYPTGNDKDIVVRARSWSSYQWDQKPATDTTSYTSHNSYYTPKSPVGVDIHIPYASWDTLHATQTDTPPTGSVIHRPIRWYQDSLQEPPFYSPSNYNASTTWNTPQYFRDTTYFLSCVSAHGTNPASTCTSYYSPVHVFINPRVAVDMAVLEVTEPRDNRVYMTYDSVKVRIINYGSQTQNSIPVRYQLYDRNMNIMQDVLETCTASIAPDSTYIYRFDSLITIPSWTYPDNEYYVRAWTEMPNEAVPINDSMRFMQQFFAVPDNNYPEAVVENKPGLDITRVAYSSMDNYVSPAGHMYINFTNATMNNGSISVPAIIDSLPLPDYGGTANAQQLGELRALHLVKGTSDTMIVEVENSDKGNDISTTAWLSVWIDVDRDGSFLFNAMNAPDSATMYDYPNTEIFYHDTIVASHPKKFLLTLPENIRTGYTRMRVVVQQGAYKPQGFIDKTITFGCVHDYLLYIEDVPTDIDVAASRIVAPRSKFIGGNTGYNAGDSVTVSVQITNKGGQPINGATVSYRFQNTHEAIHSGTVNFNGTLGRGESAVVDLPSRVFAEGVTNLRCVVTTPGDTLNLNDTLLYQYYRAPIKTLIYFDDFEGLSEWFTPRGYSPFNVNLWQRGRSHKPNIMACVSDSNVMATNLNGFVSVSATGNVSYAYTPIFDISVLRPDTLDLWVARDMAEGHLSCIEYCDYMGRWINISTGQDTLWYNTGSGWDSVSSGYGYEFCRFPLSKIGSDFQQRLQFRMVYKAETESMACDGIAIDDFKVGRARRNLDVGVIAITYPVLPKFGQTINPKVIIKNYGLDTLYSIELAYLPYGSNLAKIGTYVNDDGLLPGATDLFEFNSPFVVRNDFPDTFSICSYTTVNMDLYRDNDSVCAEFGLAPLDNDMGMVSFQSPLERCIAGDSIVVTTRIRNFGQAPVASAEVTYIFNGTFRVTETVNFVEILGHELGSFEFLNYSFKQKFRSSMGIMNLMAFVHMDNDDYVYNDTIAMKVQGLSAIVDLKARAVVVNTSNQNATRMQVIIDNVGARSVSEFRVGFWYYNDTSTLIETTYHCPTPFPALSSIYFQFDNALTPHEQYYRYVTAYVKTDGDVDPSNDTTDVIVERWEDLHAIRVLVEENRTDSCRVRFEFENLGNVVSRSDQKLFVSGRINGQYIEGTYGDLGIEPGRVYYVDLPKKILKNHERQYTGYLELSKTGDNNPDNNQTTRIEVVNYLGIPLAVREGGMRLDQNYPNPFDNTTRIDFYLPSSGSVRFFVMDELGRLVFQKVGEYGSGDNSIRYDAGDLTSGVYYYGIEKDGKRLMRRMVLKH